MQNIRRTCTYFSGFNVKHAVNWNNIQAYGVFESEGCMTAVDSYDSC